MRNFEEIKAEILSRSEKKIKEKKRRREKVLALSIPLCIIIAVCSITILPNLMKTEPMEISEQNDYTDEGADTEIKKPFGSDSAPSVGTEEEGITPTHGFVMVEVKNENGEICSQINDKAELDSAFNEIYFILLGYESYGEIPGEILDAEGTSDDFDIGKSDEDDNTKAIGYEIALFSENNEKRIFILKGNKLYDTLNSVEVKLNDSQLVSLKSALGLLK